MAWTPGRRGPLPRGASSEEIQAAFPEWTLVDDEPKVLKTVLLVVQARLHFHCGQRPFGGSDEPRLPSPLRHFVPSHAGRNPGGSPGSHAFAEDAQVLPTMLVAASGR
jgi:hypothetical protein